MCHYYFVTPPAKKIILCVIDKGEYRNSVWMAVVSLISPLYIRGLLLHPSKI
ncbi:phenazine biosynthesis-like, partial [Moniliophthora roreri]